MGEIIGRWNQSRTNEAIDSSKKPMSTSSEKLKITNISTLSLEILEIDTKRNN